MDWTTLWNVLPVALSIVIMGTVHAQYVLAMRRNLRSSACGVHSRPLVSILKPISGVDDELEDNLASFAELDYPRVELLIGIASADDPAIPIVRCFLTKNQNLRARLVFTAPTARDNPKVMQLISLTSAALGDVLVVSDANVRVPVDYISKLVSELDQPGVGLVSSVIYGRGARTLGALLDNAQLNVFVAPLVVTSAERTSQAVTVGKSMAMRRADLAAVGGWAIVRDVLAEDEMLGRAFRAHGFRVSVSRQPVSNVVVSYTLLRTLDRHARWAKMRRAIAPGYFLLEPLLSPTWVAALMLPLSGPRLGVELVSLALAFQVSSAYVASRVLGSHKQSLRMALVEPLRTLMHAVCWGMALVSNRVHWKGHRFALTVGSRLLPCPPRTVRRRLA